ncbi:MAG: DNA topoisomerase IV subunit A, partial [Candidatus Electrothrix sp. AR5]|nr:DNA topoisomerase IV subunit A [Candidatus Electrothrix sp. AR5]
MTSEPKKTAETTVPDQQQEKRQGKLHKLFDDNFLDYTSYVIRERAIPDIDDGLKPVQRRLLQTLYNMDDGRYHKVANVVGETMKLHPHGDQSIFAALVNLANKNYLIDRQGNFGNIYTGDQASAARYIECRLTPLARETLFNKDLTEFVDSYDGRMQEPVSLPSKLPMLLLLGAEGIAVGMATKIMPHNFRELLQCQIKYLVGEEFTLYPDFPKGG